MDADEPLTILQFSDLHILANREDTLMGVKTESYWKRVFQLALQNHPDPDLILITGDLTQGSGQAGYLRILDTLSTTEAPTICLPGNHDDFELMQKTMNSGNVSCRKRVQLDHWQILCLNSQVIGETGGRLAETELEFVNACLQQHPDLYSLIALHHHCTPCGSAWMDTMQLQNSTRFFQELSSHPNVKIITSGHIHQCLNIEKNGIQVVSIPSTCFQFKPSSRKFAVEKTAPGYRWFKLFSDGNLETSVVRLETQLNEIDTESGGY